MSPLILGIDALLANSSVQVRVGATMPTREDVQALSVDLVTRAEWLTALAARGAEVSAFLRRLGVGGPLEASSRELLDLAERALSRSRMLNGVAYSLPLGAPPLPREPRRAGCCVAELRDEIRHRLQLERYTPSMLSQDLAVVGWRRSVDRIWRVEQDEEPIPAAMLFALKVVLGIVRHSGARPIHPHAERLLAIGRRAYHALHGCPSQPTA